MKTNKILISVFTLSVLFFSSCTDDLNTEPEVQDTLGNILEDNPDAIRGLLAKLYGNFVLQGAGDPNGDQQEDLPGKKADEAVYFRAFWNMQELTADLVKNRWGDGGLNPLTTTSQWVSTNKFFDFAYNRFYFQIAHVNNFLIETAGLDFDEKESMRAEARFIRALSYYHAMDLFGGVPIVTEDDGIGSGAKARATREEVFNYIEAELLDLREGIPVSQPYGRVNRGSVDMLLAKIYLNAEVYTGTSQFDKALTACQAVINNPSFSIDSDYQSIFQGDNFTSPEIIFPFMMDEARTRSFGGTTYIINGSASTETMDLPKFGLNDGWTGHHCSKAIYGLFGDLNDDSEDTSIDDTDGNEDKRAIFHSRGHSYEMENYLTWEDGYATTKFRNTFSDNAEVPLSDHSNTDFPLFRLGDAYLMYAEAHLRNGGGDRTTALNLVNQLRERAYGNTTGNITDAELTLDFIIDERARELYYEAHRRQDLIRFGRFTGGAYTWPWKGGVASGTSIPVHYNLFPLPLTVLQANPNLEQNTGY